MDWFINYVIVDILEVAKNFSSVDFSSLLSLGSLLNWLIA